MDAPSDDDGFEFLGTSGSCNLRPHWHAVHSEPYARQHAPREPHDEHRTRKQPTTPKEAFIVHYLQGQIEQLRKEEPEATAPGTSKEAFIVHYLQTELQQFSTHPFESHDEQQLPDAVAAIIANHFQTQLSQLRNEMPDTDTAAPGTPTEYIADYLRSTIQQLQNQIQHKPPTDDDDDLTIYCIYCERYKRTDDYQYHLLSCYSLHGPFPGQDTQEAEEYVMRQLGKSHDELESTS